MTTITIRPVLDGGLDSLWYNQDSIHVSNNYAYINESSADDDTTFIYTYETGTQRISFKMTSVPYSGNIGSVVIYAKLKNLGTSSNVKLGFYNGSTYSESSNILVSSSSWTYYSATYNTNPISGLNWTWNDINTYEITLTRMTGGGTMECTQLYVDINYSDASTQTLILRPNANGSYTDWIASTGNLWSCVDEDPASDYDYIYTGVDPSGVRCSFALPDPSDLGRIRTVIVRARMYNNAINNIYRIGIYNGSSYIETYDLNQVTGYALFSGQYYHVNPLNSNNNWTWSDINSLQPMLYGKLAGGSLTCSQIYLEIAYTLYESGRRSLGFCKF